MIDVATLSVIRRWALREQLSFREIARRTGLSRNTIRKYLREDMARRMAACITCHGRDGQATNSGYFPRLAGKPAGYLYEQLRSFRDGRRQQADMSHLLANLSDAYVATPPLTYRSLTVSAGQCTLLSRGTNTKPAGWGRTDLQATAS